MTKIAAVTGAASGIGLALSGAYPVDRLAEDTLREMERNRGLIIVPASARISAFLYRLAPRLVQGAGRKAFAAELRERARS